MPSTIDLLVIWDLILLLWAGWMVKGWGYLVIIFATWVLMLMGVTYVYSIYLV